MVQVLTDADSSVYTVQVLPAVDIDSLSPASSPRGSDIHITNPDTPHNAGYLQTFHYQVGVLGSDVFC